MSGGVRASGGNLSYIVEALPLTPEVQRRVDALELKMRGKNGQEYEVVKLERALQYLIVRGARPGEIEGLTKKIGELKKKYRLNN